MLFILINKIDLFFFNKKFLDFNYKNKIIKKLNLINQINTFPITKGFIDYFDTNSVQEIKKYNLDMIYRNEFNIIKGKILNLPKFGIWSFHHGDNKYYRGGPAGFWEILNYEDTTGVTLQILNNKLDGGRVIEKGFYPTQSTFVRNNLFILEKSSSILLKNIKILYYNSNIKTRISNSKKHKIYKYPDKLKYIIKYLYIIFVKFFLLNLKKNFFSYLNIVLICGHYLLLKIVFFQKNLKKLFLSFHQKIFFMLIRF